MPGNGVDHCNLHRSVWVVWNLPVVTLYFGMDLRVTDPSVLHVSLMQEYSGLPASLGCLAGCR